MTAARRRKDNFKDFLIRVTGLIAICILFAVLQNRPNGMQIFAMVAYTVAVMYIASNRLFNLVRFNRLSRARLLLLHCLALVIVYVITTEALAVKPRLPNWFVRRDWIVSLFDWCLMWIFLILAAGEYLWAMRPFAENTDRNI